MLKLLIGANLVLIAVFVLFVQQLPPQIPLYFSQLWGEDQLTESYMIFLLPVTMTGIYFFNHFIHKKYFDNNRFVGRIIFYVNLFVIFTLSFVFIKIILTII